MYAPNTPAPAWLTRAKAILLRLESEDLEQSARSDVFRQTITKPSLDRAALNSRIQTLNESASQSDSAFKNGDVNAARANLATEKSNLENEIQALDAEIEQARQRGANASQRALQAATNYRVAKKVYLTLTAGAIIQTAVGVA